VRWSYDDPRFKRVQHIFGKKRPEKDYDEARAILRQLIQETQRECPTRRGRRTRPSTPRRNSCFSD
jgi:hypothetical protein